MGVNLKDILVRKPLELEQLSGKILAVDAFNTLYQFLTTIRAPDGNYLTDHTGRITSHLIGLFNRSIPLLEKNIRLVFVFDGIPPALKKKEIERRKTIKQEARQAYEEAAERRDEEAMRKYAARMTTLNEDMINDAKKLLELLGIPVLQAPSEGEAQCSQLAKEGTAWAAVSQDYDSLLYEAPRVVQNLTIAGRRNKIHGKGTVMVTPEMLDLHQNLSMLGISAQQLRWLSILVGTDYCPGGIKGIGPKKALALVKQHTTAEEVFAAAKWNENMTPAWQEVLATFEQMPVTQNWKPQFGTMDATAVEQFLVREHDFSQDRVQQALEKLGTRREPTQKGLGDFT